jgi:dienelactone hydrolase
VAEITRLALHTADGRPLMHKFYRRPDSAAGILFVFPGARYGMDGPLLYYPNEGLRALGWDTFALHYGFQTAMQAMAVDQVPGLIEEAAQAVHVVLAARDYPRIGLVGKSLGASVVAQLCLMEPGLAGARAAYLTPALGNAFFDPSFSATVQPAYLAMGTLDRYYQEDALAKLETARAFELALVPGVDHSFNAGLDVETALRAVERVVTDVIRFMSQD